MPSGSSAACFASRLGPSSPKEARRNHPLPSSPQPAAAVAVKQRDHISPLRRLRRHIPGLSSRRFGRWRSLFLTTISPLVGFAGASTETSSGYCLNSCATVSRATKATFHRPVSMPRGPIERESAYRRRCRSRRARGPSGEIFSHGPGASTGST